jgi:ABC-type transporter Mla MlaB component
MSDTELENQPGGDSPSGQSLNGNKEQSSSVGQERILELKRNKRVRKAAVTRLRHSIEKLCVKKDEIDIQLVEKQVASLWNLLEKNMDIMDELSVMYAKVGEHENRQACLKEADAVEAEVMQAIEKAESVIN